MISTFSCKEMKVYYIPSIFLILTTDLSYNTILEIHTNNVSNKIVNSLSELELTPWMRQTSMMFKLSIIPRLFLFLFSLATRYISNSFMHGLLFLMGKLEF